MKRFSIICITLLIAGFFLLQNLQAQEWVKQKQDPAVHFQTTVKSFNDYWNARAYERSKGWKPFRRWEYFMRGRVDSNGIFANPAIAWQEFEKYKLSHSGMKSNSSGSWTSIGPFTVPPGGGGAGRLNCIRFHPTDPLKLYAGAPAGGLWISNDGGNTWNCNTDLLPVIGVSDIAIAPTNPSVMYLGTSDGDAGDTYSIGVLKSTDGGITWNTTGLNWAMNFSRRISRILVHPTDENIVLAATSNGIWKTTDGGTTWNIARSGNFKDMEFKPGNPAIVYACGTTLYRSSNNGTTFSNLTNFSLPSNISRLAIAVTEANSSYLYILAGGGDNGFFGLYRSEDNANTFSQQSNSPNLLGWDINGGDNGGQAWYDLALAVSHSDANQVYVGGVNIWKSADGGVNWELNAHWYGGGGKPYVHADVHDLSFVPGSGSTLFAATDGGLFKTTNSGTAWNDLSNGLSIGQIYRLGVSSSTTTHIISGWQDNGTNLYNNTWSRVIGGDGMDCQINQTNSNYVYGSLYYGDLFRSTDAGNNFTNISSPITEDGDWVTPFILDPTDQATIYAGYHNLWKSTDHGTTWSQISNFATTAFIQSISVCKAHPENIFISYDNIIYRTADAGTTWNPISATLPYYSVPITRIVVHPDNPDVLWITYNSFSNGNKVFATRNGGLTWANVSGTLPNLPVNCIVYEEGSPEGLYIGTDVGIYYKDSTLTDWQWFSNGLPNVVVFDLDINYAESKIVAGTYGRGVWISPLHEPVGINSHISEKNELNIFPNPGNGEFQVKLPYTANKGTLEIYDMMGKKVHTTDFTHQNFSFDIRILPAGIYSARVMAGKENYTTRIIKNNP
ncbi:MAG: T9SS type A sorting domain-containing protein [Bacteroidota bacterium]